MKSFGCMPAVRTPEASRTLTVSCPGILPSPLRDKVGAFHHDRFRGYVSVYFRSGLHPPCLRFAVAVAGHHARLGTRLLVRLCRGRHHRRLNSMRLQGATPTDPLPYSGTQVLLPFGVSSLCRRRRTGHRSAFRLRKSRSARDRRAPSRCAGGAAVRDNRTKASHFPLESHFRNVTCIAQVTRGARCSAKALAICSPRSPAASTVSARGGRS